MKHAPGPWLFAGAVSGGYGWHDTDRPIVLPGLALTAESDHKVWNVTGRLRAEYLVDLGPSYVKPRVDVTVSHVGFSGFTEDGGNEALTVRGMEETTLGLSPAVEWGAQFETAYGALMRPYLWAGVTAFAGGDFAVAASFNGAPGIEPFSVAKEIDPLMADVGAGLEFIGAGGATLRLDYSGRFSQDLEEHGLGLKASLPF